MKNSPWITLAAAALLLAGLVGCSSTKVYVDYDQDADFDSYETFQYHDAGDATSLIDSAPLIHTRLVNAIVRQLEVGGLTKTESNPDLYVTYHTSTREEVSVNTSSYGYGYPSRWYRDPFYYGGMGMAGSTTTVSTYEMGTLVIDVWDAKSKHLLWRGTADGRLTDDPAKVEKGIQDVLAKMVEESRKKMSGG